MAASEDQVVQTELIPDPLETVNGLEGDEPPPELREGKKPRSAPRAIHFALTLNNPTTSIPEDNWAEHADPFELFDKHLMRYLIYQLEVGASGTRHLQIYIQFVERQYLTAVKKMAPFSRAHIEICRATPAKNIAYCSKAEGRVAGPWKWGRPLNQGERYDLRDVATRVFHNPAFSPADEAPEICLKYSTGLKYLKEQALRKARGNEFRRPCILVYCGPSGCGKSSFAYRTDPELYSVPHHEGASLWFDGYSGQRTILFDDFYGGVAYSHWLRILDGYPFQLQVKGGFVWLNHFTTIITSNVSPEHWYKPEIQSPAYAMVRRLREFGSVFLFNTETNSFEPYEVQEKPIQLISQGVSSFYC